MYIFVPISPINVATVHGLPSAYLDWCWGRHFSLTLNGLVSCGSGHHLRQAEALFTMIRQLILKLGTKTQHYKLRPAFRGATEQEAAPIRSFGRRVPSAPRPSYHPLALLLWRRSLFLTPPTHLCRGLRLPTFTASF